MEEGFSSSGEWDAGFEAGRRVVVSRLGPFLRVFPRPERYVRRFYHSLYDLTIEDWQIRAEKKILGGFCTLRASLTIRFQPTVRYLEENLDALPDLSEHIKTHYAGLLKDAFEQGLLQADDGAWVEQGLDRVEAGIETAVNETLVMQNIRCRSRCEIDPAFEKTSLEEEAKLTGDFRHELACLEIMRRNYAFREKQNSELLRQERLERETRLHHESALFEQLRRDEQQHRVREEYETARLKAELEEQERREAERMKSEERRNIERIKLENKIKQMELAMQIEDRKLRHQATIEADELLRREIELLVLEKQRSSLGRQIKRVGAEDDADF